MISTLYILGLLLIIVFRKNLIKIYDYLENRLINSSKQENEEKFKPFTLNTELGFFFKPHYPTYISDKLSDNTLMDELVQKGYQSPFDFLNLKELHENYLTDKEEIKNRFKKFKKKKIDRNDFHEIDCPEYWVILYKDLMYVFNGEKVFPLQDIYYGENQERWWLKILYIPQCDLIKSNSYIIDSYFFHHEIFTKISNIDVQREFLKRYSYLFQDSYDDLGYLTSVSNLKFEDKNKLLLERNEIDFIVLVYLIDKNKLDFDIKKILEILFTKGKKVHQDIIKITKTSDKILTKEDIINLLEVHITNKYDFLKLFKVELINQFIKDGGLFNPKSLVSEVYNLDLDFYYSSSYNSYEKTFKSHEFEYKSKEKLSKFKKNYFREIRETLRKFENQIRLDKGFNLVGTYTNETILFQSLKTYFNDYIVVSQGSPKWLGLQRIDIYFPEFNIGVEYHGEQHFVPVDYFGGEEGLKKNIERDERKLKLCLENDCKLFVVDKNYDFSILCKKIEQEISKKNKSI